MLEIALAALHLLALAIGLPSVVGRARALGAAARGAPRAEPLRRAFAADSLWGLAAVLWIGTGLWRYLAGTDKGTAYYDSNALFLAKMGALAAILLLEIWPMVTLLRWRMALRRGASADAAAGAGAARRMALVSWTQAALVVAMVFLAAGMARGFGATSGG